MAEQFKATVTPTGMGSAGTAGEATEANKKANMWGNLLKTGVQAANLSANVIAQQNKAEAEVDSLKGYQAGVELRKDMLDVAPTESYKVYQSKVDGIIGGTSEFSDAYNKGLLSSIKSSYESTSLQAEDINNTKYVSQKTSAFIIDQGDNITVDSFKAYVKDTSNMTGISPSKVRDVSLATLSSSITDILVGVNDTESLNRVKNSYGKLQADLNKDSQLFGTTTKGVGGEVVKKAKADIKNAFASAQTRINGNLDSEAASADIKFNLLPKEYEENKIKRYGRGSKEHITQVAAYRDKFEDNELTTSLLAEGNGETGYDWVKLGRTKNGVKEAKEHVQAFQQNALEGGDLDKYVVSVSNNPQHSKEVGLELTKSMNTFNTEEEGLMAFNKYGKILAAQDGPNALFTSQGKDYKPTRLAFELWKTGAVKSVTDARENASIATSSNNLVAITMKPQEKSYLAKKANEWGGQSSEFRFLANNIIALGTSPDKATDMVTKLYEDRKKEVGGTVITNAPAKMLVGNEQLFSDNIGTQITEQLKLEDGEYSADNYTIKGSDDFSDIGLVYEKETGVYVATVNFKAAKDSSVDPESLVKIAEEDKTLNNVKTFFDETGNEIANTIDRFVEDPTGSALKGMQDIGDFFIAAEGTKSQEVIRAGIDFISKEATPQTTEERIETGKSRIRGSIDKRGPNTVGPRELFQSIGRGITNTKEVLNSIIERFTPKAIRDEDITNTKEAEIINTINSSKVKEAQDTIDKLNLMEEKMKGIRPSAGLEGANFDIPDTPIEDPNAFGGASSLAINELINPGQQLDPETGLEIEDETVNDLFNQATTRDNQNLLDTIEGDTPTTEEAVVESQISELDRETFTQEGEVTNDQGLHIPYESAEGGNDTIGRGHKLLDSEVSSGEIIGIDYTEGLTDTEANTIYLSDKERLTSNLGLTGLSEEIKFLAADVAHRAGNISGWKFLTALKDNDLDEAYAQLGDLSYTDSNGDIQFYNSRNSAIFNRVGHTPSPEAVTKYNKLQQDKRDRS